MKLRKRNEQGVIKIGLVEMYGTNKEDAIIPYPMKGNNNSSWENHATDVIEIIRQFVPNAEFHLVRGDRRGLQYLIDQECAIVNISLSGTYAKDLEEELSKKSFLIVSAGNDGEEGETLLARQNYSCAIGAVNSQMKPMYYSGYGYGAIVAVAQEPNIDGRIYHGTSFSAPVVTGLLSQWYIWYYNLFDCYPCISETYDFIKFNSADIFEDDYDLRTGYGLLRLPKKFKATAIIVETGNRFATKIKHVEGEKPTISQVDLLVTPFIHNSRTMVGSRGLMESQGINVHWDIESFVSVYIR